MEKRYAEPFYFYCAGSSHVVIARGVWYENAAPSSEEVLMETDDTLKPQENSENSDGIENSQESPDTEVLTNEELAALIKKDDREEIDRIITTAEDAIRWKR